MLVERLVKPLTLWESDISISLCQVKTHANTGDDKLRWLFSAHRCLQALQRFDGLIHIDLVLGEGMGGVLESGNGQHAQRLHGLRLVF